MTAEGASLRFVSLAITCAPNIWHCFVLANYLRINFIQTGIQPSSLGTHREILLNHTGIGLYLPLSDLFGSKRTSLWFQMNSKAVSRIWFRFDLIGFRIDFSVCSLIDFLCNFRNLNSHLNNFHTEKCY